ncbi:hypothetical protein MMMDOFMJ_0928 [Methylobacterium gnaphalii]|nr:hypothetical protein MMMDOFMJ_0928 [Methylobacterium gnaphalii]
MSHPPEAVKTQLSGQPAERHSAQNPLGISS